MLLHGYAHTKRDFTYNEIDYKVKSLFMCKQMNYLPLPKSIASAPSPG